MRTAVAGVGALVAARLPDLAANAHLAERAAGSAHLHLASHERLDADLGRSPLRPPEAAERRRELPQRRRHHRDEVPGRRQDEDREREGDDEAHAPIVGSSRGALP